VAITNELGVKVHEFTIEPSADGHYSWDGRGAGGQRLPEGTYTVAYVARDAAGASMAVRALWQGRIDTVRFREGIPWLVGDGLEFSLAQVSEVSREAASDDGGGSAARALDIQINW
jgi:flagellar hook assembly protein FlgD